VPGTGLPALVTLWLQPELRIERGWIYLGFYFSRSEQCGTGTIGSVCQYCFSLGLYDVPRYVCHNNRGLDYRSCRGADQVRGSDRIFITIVDSSLLPGVALGLGQRLLAG
jgi:hypothetical protein